jgi:hypothetical protein
MFAASALESDDSNWQLVRKCKPSNSRERFKYDFSDQMFQFIFCVRQLKVKN